VVEDVDEEPTTGTDNKSGVNKGTYKFTVYRDLENRIIEKK